jgi:hypothetical protein
MFLIHQCQTNKFSSANARVFFIKKLKFLLELFKKFLFSIFENGISGYANFKSSDDYTEFITRMDKYEY